MKSQKVLIVGGGIAGLTAAYRLARLAEVSGEPLEITLLEAEDRLGGKIRTEHAEGLTIEIGPDSFITAKPHALELVRELGLEPRLVNTQPVRSDVYVYARGGLRRLPGGFALAAPSRWMPFLRSDLLTWPGKLRMGMDLLAPRGRSEDESMADFARRRFGCEALNTVVQPILAGIYAGDAEHLSLKSTFPRFLDLERDFGSVIRGLMAGSKRGGAGSGFEAKGGGGRSGPTMFVTLAGGLEELVQTLSARLVSVRVRLRTRVRKVESSASGCRAILEDGPDLEADGLILATPAPAAAGALRETDSELSAELSEIPFSSSATLTLAYPTSSLPALPPGFGVVVARGESRIVSAATFASAKFPGRAPEGTTLLRCFLGGAGLDAGLERSNGAVIFDARADLERILGIRAEPRLARLHRWIGANPQYVVGHERRIERIEERLLRHPRLALAGASYRGVGIPDCIASGARAAHSLYNQLMRGVY